MSKKLLAIAFDDILKINVLYTQNHEDHKFMSCIDGQPFILYVPVFFFFVCFLAIFCSVWFGDFVINVHLRKKVDADNLCHCKRFCH